MKKSRKVWTLDDLKPRDIELLSSAAARSNKTFFCFGLAWYKLYDLHLIDEDTVPTKFGREVVASYARSHQ